MAYKVVVTSDAKENMQKYIEYILYEKKNQQAAASLLDAYEFAKGKPIQLINGAELLGLLEKHGHKAKIDLKEAKLINKGNNNLI